MDDRANWNCTRHIWIYCHFHVFRVHSHKAICTMPRHVWLCIQECEGPSMTKTTQNMPQKKSVKVSRSHCWSPLSCDHATAADVATGCGRSDVGAGQRGDWWADPMVLWQDAEQLGQVRVCSLKKLYLCQGDCSVAVADVYWVRQCSSLSGFTQN